MRGRGAARSSGGPRVPPDQRGEPERPGLLSPSGQVEPLTIDFPCLGPARRFDGRKGPCHENWALIAAAFASASPRRLLPFP